MTVPKLEGWALRGTRLLGAAVDLDMCAGTQHEAENPYFDLWGAAAPRIIVFVTALHRKMRGTAVPRGVVLGIEYQHCVDQDETVTQTTP